MPHYLVQFGAIFALTKSGMLVYSCQDDVVWRKLFACARGREEPQGKSVICTRCTSAVYRRGNGPFRFGRSPRALSLIDVAGERITRDRVRLEIASHLDCGVRVAADMPAMAGVPVNRGTSERKDGIR